MLILIWLLFSPALIIFWLHAWLHCLYYQKIFWFVFDLIYVVIVSSSKFYSSELTKFELLTTIVEDNCVYLSSQNECVLLSTRYIC